MPMSTSDQMAVLRALVSSPSNLLMMLAMQSNNSMVMIGKVAHSRFVKTVSLALVLDSADEVALEVGEASEVALAVGEASEVEEDLAVVSAVVVEALGAAMEAPQVVVSMLEHLLHPQTPLLTTLLLAPREVRRSTFAT